MGLTKLRFASMSNLKYLNLAVSQVQGNMGLASMSDPKHLDLAITNYQVLRLYV